MSFYYIDFLSKVDSQLDTNLKINRIKYDSSIVPEDIRVPEKFSHTDWKDLIPKPPTNSSNQTILELQEVSKLVNNRTSQDDKLIYLVDKEPLDLFYPILKKYNIAFPDKLFKNKYKDVYNLVKAIKEYYNRPRPYQLASFFDINIKNIETKTHHTPSYPSGHTAYSYLAYKTVITLYPNILEMKKDLYNCVYLTGRARMMQGIHYLSDINAAILLIDQLYYRGLL